jgi:septal ring factor EnvC (AmiA/AmiB activator)
LLDQLKRTHAELEAALAAMKQEIQADSPAKSDYATARWKLSQASRNRRALVARICAQLAPRVPEPQAKMLRDHHADDVQMLHRSAAHVGRWTMESIEADWLGYRAASAEIRATMSRRLEAEKQSLYPILERFQHLA